MEKLRGPIEEGNGGTAVALTLISNACLTLVDKYTAEYPNAATLVPLSFVRDSKSQSIPPPRGKRRRVRSQSVWRI